MTSVFTRIMPRIRFQAAGIVAVAATAIVSASCDVSNIVIPPFGVLTITTEVQPDDAQDFTFTTTGPELPGFTLDDDGTEGAQPKMRAFSIAPGQYTVTENAVAGWQTPDVACVNTNSKTATFTAAGTGVTINMVDGAVVACTFVNVKNVASGARAAAE